MRAAIRFLVGEAVGQEGEWYSSHYGAIKFSPCESVREVALVGEVRYSQCSSLVEPTGLATGVTEHLENDDTTELFAVLLQPYL